MSGTSNDKGQYVSKEDTWRMVAGECPVCKSSIKTNGAITDCPGCSWWSVNPDK